MPINYQDYPTNWKTEIRPMIMARAKHCCEVCGAEHLSLMLSKSRVQLTAPFTSYRVAKESAGWYHEPGDKAIVIVLTIAHLDHDTANNAPENLKALCQRCHLEYDQTHHRRNASAKRNRMPGQGELFEKIPATNTKASDR